MKVKKNLDSVRRVINTINDQYGSIGMNGKKSKIVSIVSETEALSISRIPSGVFAVDAATGGGVAIGRVNGIEGPKAGGKSTLALLFARSAQKMCRYCKTEMSKIEGEIVFNKVTGEYIKVEDFLNKESDFWKEAFKENRKLSKEVLFYFDSKYIEKSDSVKYSKSAVDSADKFIKEYMNKKSFYFEKDTVYDCSCGKADPMMVLWADIEHVYDNKWYGELGIDDDLIAVIKPISGEQAVDQIIFFMNSGEFDLIVIDSLGALVPTKQLEGSAEDSYAQASLARLLNAFERKMLATTMNKKDLNDPYKPECTVIQINHLLSRINKPGEYGPKLIRPGGDVQNYAESMTIRVRKGAFEKDTKLPPRYLDIGFETTTNKTFPPKRVGSFRFWLEKDEKNNHAVGDTEEVDVVIKAAIEHGVISKNIEKSVYVYRYKKLEEKSTLKIKSAILREGLFSELRSETFEKVTGR